MAQILRPTTMTSDASEIVGAARNLWSLRMTMDKQYYFSSTVTNTGEGNPPDFTSLATVWGYDTPGKAEEMYFLLLNIREQILAETINGEPNALAVFLAKVG
jgi:hypothetical protein